MISSGSSAAASGRAPGHETAGTVVSADDPVPRNATVLVVLVVCTLSVAGAVFLILELTTPFAGLMQVSSGPLRDAIALLGK